MDIVTQISAADFQAIYQNSQQLQRQTGVETFSKIVNGEPVTVASDIANFKVSDKEKAAKEFEVMVLSQFIGEWLNSESHNLMGPGPEGEYFAPVFSKALAEEISDSHDFGIAKFLGK